MAGNVSLGRVTEKECVLQAGHVHVMSCFDRLSLSLPDEVSRRFEVKCHRFGSMTWNLMTLAVSKCEAVLNLSKWFR